jgi:hypothetical protein
MVKPLATVSGSLRILLGAALLIGCAGCRQPTQHAVVRRALTRTPFSASIRGMRMRVTYAPPRVRRVIEMGDEALPILRELLNDDSNLCRIWSVYCIGEISSDRDDAELLRELLASPEWLRQLQMGTKFAGDIIRDAVASIEERTGATGGVGTRASPATTLALGGGIWSMLP